ncbi:MAG TPA: glycosyltransferase family 39 protein [Gaiellaceae bacterium]
MATTRVARQSKARETAVELVRSVPAWAWVAALVVVSTGIRYVITRRAVAPWIMVDELIYSELAKSFADSGHFLVREHATAAYGIVYPLLLAPAWAIFHAVPDAYAAAKAINSFVMSLAAIPAYFLARRLLSMPLALAAAVLTVAVPSMVYTGTLMTENAFYPIFIATTLATVVWLERPTTRTTVLMLALVGFAYLTRAQALAFGPAILTAPLIFNWAQGRSWRSLRDYRLMYGIVVAAGIAILAVQGVRGRSPLGVLGAYEVAGQSHYRFWDVFRWFWYAVGELDLSLGVLPFAALILLTAVVRGQDRRVQAFVAAAVAISFWLMLEVSAFASVHQLRVEERNTFYIAPLFLIALLVWGARGAPRPGAVTAVTALVAGALPGVIPYEHLINLNAVSDTIGLLPIWSLHSALFPIEQVALVVTLACILAAGAFVIVPARYALVLPLLVLVYFAVSEKPIEGKHHTASIGALFAGITNPHRDWIDRAVGSNAQVAAIWSGNTDPYAIWENEIFNRSVGKVYDIGAPLNGGLPETQLTVDRRAGIMSANGSPVRSRYVLADSSVSLAGTVVAQDTRKGMFLYRLSGPLRQTSYVTGLYPQDTWSGRTAEYTRLDCKGGSVTVQLQSDPGLFTKPTTVAATVLGREVAKVKLAPTATRLLTVPLEPHEGTCVATFSVSPTAVPATVTEGENPDPRELGAHFTRFTYHP